VVISLKYPQNTTKILGAFLFLRFILPALTAPQLHIPPEYQRTLAVVAKIIGKLANESTFQESYLEEINKWIKKHLSQLYRFYDSLMACNNSYSNVVLPEKVRMDALVVVQNYIENHLHQIKKEVGGEISMDVAEYFSALEARKRNLTR